MLKQQADILCEIYPTARPLSRKNYHIGSKPAKRSTLSDANNNRPWEIYQDTFFNILGKVQKVEQLFIDGEMMPEARWPNICFPDELWTCKKWANAGPGSKHGKIVDPALAESNIDWTGAIAVLNVSDQFYTWTRPVLKHGDGSDTFEYKADLADFSWRKGKDWITGQVWEDDKYYFIGKLEALDSPGEWFYDHEKKSSLSLAARRTASR